MKHPLQHQQQLPALTSDKTEVKNTLHLKGEIQQQIDDLTAPREFCVQFTNDPIAKGVTNQTDFLLALLIKGDA